MERVGTLIHKLKEQFEQQVEPNKLLLTAQMLLAELQQKQTVNSNGKVSVTMPSVMQTRLPAMELVPEKMVAIEERPVVEIPVQNIIVEKEEEPALQTHSGWLFDPVSTVPTLAHQDVKEVLELNETMLADIEEESHNDKLKEERMEVATVLQGTPIKDLKKAIGINDRYLFINELFRGDEAMYERSIKTINSFSIYPEAEYWIQREMKTKLGWLEDAETVKLFDQLVKRRFS